MKGQISPKILGATVVGLALIAGAYTISNFGEPRYAIPTANLQDLSPTKRVAIEVTDSDNNGIEDWRDEFITTEPIILESTSTDYAPPDTLTGKMSIDFMENVILADTHGPFGSSQEEIIGRTVDSLSRETVQKLYGVKDIDIMTDWDNQDLVNYSNTLATILVRYTHTGPDNELVILHDIVANGQTERMTELKEIREVYRNYREDTIKLPVPDFLAKQHLDLINTYEAIYTDIDGMTLAMDDPAVALLRLKRYEDDATGLAYALQNMYFALLPYADLVTEDDPAALFVVFSPDYQGNF